jgi:hypothetical protein
LDMGGMPELVSDSDTSSSEGSDYDKPVHKGNKGLHPCIGLGKKCNIRSRSGSG